MLIYSPELSERLDYVLDVVLTRLLGLTYRCTNLQMEYQHYEGPKLAYDVSKPESGHYMQANGLLYERVIRNQHKSIFPTAKWNNLPVFFMTNEDSIVPFDLFSASFYLISRYEEYLPFTADQHGRYSADESLASKEGFLNQPLVNQWAIELRKILEKLYPGQLQFNPSSYRFVPTIDIDNAWAFRHKGLRSWLGFFRKPGMPERNYRYQVLTGNQPDPYDQYDQIKRITDQYGVNPVFFFLMSKGGPHDRGINPSNRQFRQLIRDIGAKFPIGIHPSYQSNNRPESINKELTSLTRITNKRVEKSRQHFIKMSFPETYRSLVALGITEDYSLGYPDQTGYRGSIGSTYPFFDVENNQKTNLELIPFQAMDVTLRQYLHFKPEQAIDHMKQMIKLAQTTHSQFSILWHNESLSEWDVWENWSQVFIQTLEAATCR